MLLTIPKKQVVVPPPAELVSDFAELIDNVGKLTQESEPILKKIAALQEQLKPLAKAKADLQKAIDNLELPDDAADGEELGAEFKIEVGKKGSSRSIKDMPKVVELMGPELFLKVATVTLKHLDDYLTKAQRDEVVETTRTSRSYKLIRRPKK